MDKIIKLSIIFLVLGSILISGCVDSEKPSEIDGPIKPVQNEELNEAESLALENTVDVIPKAKTLISDENGIGYDDGIKDGAASLGTMTGHAVFYSINEKIMVGGINIYGCRYDDLSKDFDIEIWDSNFNTLYSGSFNYDNYFPESFAPTTDSCFKWVTVDIPDIEINDDFYLTLFTQSVRPSWVEGEPLPAFINGGIEIGVDKNTESGSSFMVEKNPNRIVEWPSWNLKQDSTDWMVRVKCASDDNCVEVLDNEIPKKDKKIEISDISLNRLPAKTSQIGLQIGYIPFGDPVISEYDVGVHVLATINNPTGENIYVSSKIKLVSPSGKTVKGPVYPEDLIEANTIKRLKYRIYTKDKPAIGNWKVILDISDSRKKIFLDEEEMVLLVKNEAELTEVGPSITSIGRIARWEVTNEISNINILESVTDSILMAILAINGVTYNAPIAGDVWPEYITSGSYTDFINEANAAEAAINTALISIDSEKDSMLNSPQVGDVDTITLNYKNIRQNWLPKGADVSKTLFMYYDRAIISVIIPDDGSMILIDNGNADYVLDDITTNTKILMWIEDSNDKRIRDGKVEFKIKYLKAGNFDIGSNLALQIGPLQNDPHEVIRQNKIKMNSNDYSSLQDPLLIDYNKWITDPDNVYWLSIGADNEKISLNIAGS